MSRVIELSKALAEALSSSDEYLAYRKALDELENHNAARIMVEDLKKKQIEVMLKQNEKGEIPDEDLKVLTDSIRIVRMNPYASEFLSAEESFFSVYSEAMKTIEGSVRISKESPKETPETADETESSSGDEAEGN